MTPSELLSYTDSPPSCRQASVCAVMGADKCAPKTEFFKSDAGTHSSLSKPVIKPCGEYSAPQPKCNGNRIRTAIGIMTLEFRGREAEKSGLMLLLPH